jgi:hydroxymethylpyrimidine pyrophosphatase-like HAD family hydrolase
MNMFQTNTRKTFVRPLVLTDLDDTVFRNARKVPQIEMDGCAEVVTDTGNRVSVMTQRQAAFFDWITSTCEVIPVTARSLEAFRKINLPFGDGWKIAGNGAVVIRPDGGIDEEWAAIMCGELVAYANVLQEMHDAAAWRVREAGFEFVVKRYAEYGHEHCVLFSCEGQDHSYLASIAGRLHFGLTDNIHIHHNAGTLALTAGPVSKQRACEYVLSKIEGLDRRPVLAFGDSLSDLPFMSLGDFICAPNGSQIAEKTLKGIVSC